MNLRKDALCAAAEFVLAAENFAKNTPGLVATVGQIEVKPGASNVIPASCLLSVDVRHQSDASRKSACAKLKKAGQQMARLRGLKFIWEPIQETAAVPCSATLSSLLSNAARSHQKRVLKLPSGAGHDAAVLASITPVAMIFVRCRNGISHHPDESVQVKDVAVALKVMIKFIALLAEKYA